MISEYRHQLLALHTKLLEKTKAKYESEHGKIATPGAYFQLVTSHPDFQWLRPLSEAIVRIDEAMELAPADALESLERELREKLSSFEE